MPHPVPTTRLLLPCLVALVWHSSVAAEANIPHADAQVSLVRKVMEGLPRYGEIPQTIPAAEPKNDVEPGTTHLAPRVVLGYRHSPKFSELELLTEKAREAAIRKQYGSQFQYEEDKRIRDAIRLRTYATNLKLAGDHQENALIQREIDRLLVARNSDWLSQDIDRKFNSRYR